MLNNDQLRPFGVEGLVNNNPITDVYIPKSFDEKISALIETPMPVNLGLPVFNAGPNKNAYAGLLSKSFNDLKRTDPNFDNPSRQLSSVNYTEVEPYLKKDTNYDSNLSAAFGQASKGAITGGLIGATVSAPVAEGGGLGPLIGAGIGASVGFLSGLFGESGRTGFSLGKDNRNITAERQSGFGNRLTGFSNNVIDRAFEAGVGGTAALLYTPIGAFTGKDFYDWGTNPLSSYLSKGIEESEYKAKLSDSYLSKGPISKFFTGEGFQNEMADMTGFTLGMMVGVKGQGLLNKGVGTFINATGDGRAIGQLLPTLGKQASNLFTTGVKAERAGIATSELTFGSLLPDLSKGKLAFNEYGLKLKNAFKDGSIGLKGLSSFERTALASYGEGRIEAAQSYKDIYDTAIAKGYSVGEATEMATNGANKTLFGNLMILGITNRFGLDQLMKPNKIASLSKWFTKDFALDNTRRTMLKNYLTEFGKNSLKGIGIEGFAEELGQFSVGEAAKNQQFKLDPNNKVQTSFLAEFVDAYKEGLSSDEGISNWFGGALFGAIMGGTGALKTSYFESKEAKKLNIPSSLTTKMDKMTNAMMTLAKHTGHFNGQLFKSYDYDEATKEYVASPTGKFRHIDNPMRVAQLANALDNINELSKDQAIALLSPIEATLEEAKKDPILAEGLKHINDYLESFDDTGKAEARKSLEDYINSNLNKDQKTKVLITLANLDNKSNEYFTDNNLNKLYLDITKSNYVYDYMSNGLEDKLFNELDILESSLVDPNSEASQKDLFEFFGKLYKTTEFEQAKKDITEFRKSLREQVEVFKQVSNRYGDPISHVKLKNSKGVTVVEPIYVDIKAVFKSTLKQKEYQKQLEETKVKIDSLQNDIINKNPDIKKEYLDIYNTSEDVLTSKEYQDFLKSNKKEALDLMFIQDYDRRLLKLLKEENDNFKSLTNIQDILKKVATSEQTVNEELENPITTEQLEEEAKPKPTDVSATTTTTPPVVVPEPKKTSTPLSELDKKIAELEKQKEEDIKAVHLGHTTNLNIGDLGDISSDTRVIILDKINAKYKEKIEALKSKPIEEKPVKLTPEQELEFLKEVTLGNDIETGNDIDLYVGVGYDETEPKPNFSRDNLRKTYGNAYDKPAGAKDNANNKSGTFGFYEYLSNVYTPDAEVRMLLLHLNHPLAKAIIKVHPNENIYYSKVGNESKLDTEGAMLHILVNASNQFIDKNGKSLGFTITDTIPNDATVQKLLYSKNSLERDVKKIRDRFSKTEEFTDEQILELVDDYIDEQKIIYNQSLQDNGVIRPITKVGPGALIQARKNVLPKDIGIDLKKAKIIVNTRDTEGLRVGGIGLQVGTNLYPLQANKLNQIESEEIADILLSQYDPNEPGTPLSLEAPAYVSSVVNYVISPNSPNATHKNGVYRKYRQNANGTVSLAIYVGVAKDADMGLIEPIYVLDDLLAGLYDISLNPQTDEIETIINNDKLDDQVSLLSKALQEKAYYNLNEKYLKSTAPYNNDLGNKLGNTYQEYILNSDRFRLNYAGEGFLPKTNKQLYYEPIVETQVITPTDNTSNPYDLEGYADSGLNRDVFDTVEEVEDFDLFTTWLSSVLPQFAVKPEDRIIDGVAQGQLFNNLIRIYKGAEKGTGYHEAFEAVFFNILTPTEQANIIAEFKSRPGTFEYYSDKRVIAYNKATNAEAKEMLAEEFITFMKTSNLKPNNPESNNFFVRLWNSIKGLINNVLSIFGSIDKAESYVNEIYTNIARGAYKDIEIKDFYNIPQNREILRNAKGKVISNAEIEMLRQNIEYRVIEDLFKKNSYNIYQILDEELNFSKTYLDTVSKVVDDVIKDYNDPNFVAIRKSEAKKNELLAGEGLEFDMMLSLIHI